MRHRKRGRKLNRTTSHRKALRLNLALGLFENGRIITTVPKAKEVQSFCEKIISRSREKTLANYRLVLSRLQGSGGGTGLVHDRDLDEKDVPRQKRMPRYKRVTRKLFAEIGPLMKDRPGGYTRILRTGKRRLGDGAPLALFELVTGKFDKPEKAEKAEKTETASAEKA